MANPPPVPNPAEVAVVIVNGMQFQDWETVFIQHRWADSCPLFKFTCAERDPIPEVWTRLQFKPGDACEIILGGKRAVIGVITKRQVAYDARQHGVMLDGKGVTWFAARASVMDKKGEFDNMSFLQIAEKVLAPFAVGHEVIGTLDSSPFPKMQVQPGERVFDFLERIGRQKGIIIGSDELGNFLFIGPHDDIPNDSLVEGYNILRCQCIISVDEIHSQYDVRAQHAASDDNSGTQASELEASVPGTSPRYSPLLTPAEQPMKTIAEVLKRAKYESIWHEGTIIQATITVQGWFTSKGSLWQAGAAVHVYSPMAMLNAVMAIQTATFTQDSNSGTLTTLELVPPFLLRGTAQWNVGKDGVPQDPTTPQALQNLNPAPPAPGSGAFGPGIPQ